MIIAATIPLFAAAASHYATAGNPHAPRLVLLDEAFAGVDDDSRAKCLGLLAEFDLDYVLTSEREWGCYPTVPGLAIAQLSRREGVDAVRPQLVGQERDPPVQLAPRPPGDAVDHGVLVREPACRLGEQVGEVDGAAAHHRARSRMVA